MTTPVESDAADRTAGLAGEDRAVHLRRTFDQPVGTIWQALISPQGLARWLGEGAVLGGKGESYHCLDGSLGVVRSFHPLEQLRLSWHRDEDAPPTLVEIDLAAHGSGSTIELRHDGLDPTQRERAELRWAQRFDAFADSL